VAEPATREELRDVRTEFRQELGPIKEDIGELKTGFALLLQWQKNVIDRNRSIPGWLFNSLGLAIPILAAAISWWLAMRFPGLLGGP